MLDRPTTPSTVALIVIGPPSARALTVPLDETVTAASLVELQVTVRPGTGIPLAVFGVAVSWAVPPSTTTPVAGTTSTVETRSTSATPSPLPQEIVAARPSDARTPVQPALTAAP